MEKVEIQVFWILILLIFKISGKTLFNKRVHIRASVCVGICMYTCTSEHHVYYAYCLHTGKFNNFYWMQFAHVNSPACYHVFITSKPILVGHLQTRTEWWLTRVDQHMNVRSCGTTRNPFSPNSANKCQSHSFTTLFLVLAFSCYLIVWNGP